MSEGKKPNATSESNPINQNNGTPSQQPTQSSHAYQGLAPNTSGSNNGGLRFSVPSFQPGAGSHPLPGTHSTIHPNQADQENTQHSEQTRPLAPRSRRNDGPWWTTQKLTDEEWEAFQRVLAGRHREGDEELCGHLDFVDSPLKYAWITDGEMEYFYDENGKITLGLRQPRRAFTNVHVSYQERDRLDVQVRAEMNAAMPEIQRRKAQIEDEVKRADEALSGQPNPFYRGSQTQSDHPQRPGGAARSHEQGNPSVKPPVNPRIVAEHSNDHRIRRENQNQDNSASSRYPASNLHHAAATPSYGSSPIGLPTDTVVREAPMQGNGSNGHLSHLQGHGRGYGRQQPFHHYGGSSPIVPFPHQPQTPGGFLPMHPTTDQPRNYHQNLPHRGGSLPMHQGTYQSQNSSSRRISAGPRVRQTMRPGDESNSGVDPSSLPPKSRPSPGKASIPTHLAEIPSEQQSATLDTADTMAKVSTPPDNTPQETILQSAAPAISIPNVNLANQQGSDVETAPHNQLQSVKVAIRDQSAYNLEPAPPTTQSIDDLAKPERQKQKRQGDQNQTQPRGQIEWKPTPSKSKVSEPELDEQQKLKRALTVAKKESQEKEIQKVKDTGGEAPEKLPKKWPPNLDLVEDDSIQEVDDESDQGDEDESRDLTEAERQRRAKNQRKKAQQKARDAAKKRQKEDEQTEREKQEAAAQKKGAEEEAEEKLQREEANKQEKQELEKTLRRLGKERAPTNDSKRYTGYSGGI